MAQPQPELILASTSLYRRQLLKRLGIPFRCVSPGFDEEIYKGRGEEPVRLARTLAAGKARSVARQNPEAIVIGSDQLAAMAGDVLGKPGSRDRAIEQLTRLAGKSHDLITALCVITPDREILVHDVTRLTMRAVTHEEITRYVTRDEPFDCAGSYKIEAAGIALFERIETEDFTAIIGLPLLRLVSLLREAGLPVI